MRSATSESAREHLLDVAEGIIARDGLRALTTRSLTQAANVNVASVNYFFGTKDTLLIGLQQRMFQPMSQERLERFDALEAADPLNVRDVVQALIEPLSRMREQHGTPSVELYRYLLAHPEPQVRTVSWELLEPALLRFEELVVLALPRFPRKRLIERVHLVCQIAVPAALSALDVFDLTEGTPPMGELIDFITGGLTAPMDAPYPAT